MKDVNFNFQFKGLDGKDLGENAGILLSRMLAASNSKTPVKFWEWAMAFHSGQTIKLTTDDCKMLIDFIKDNESMTALAKAQIINVLQ